MRLFNLLKNVILFIRGIKNTHYHASVTGITGTYRTSFTVCSLELPIGVYFLIGNVGASVDNSSTVMLAGLSGATIITGQGRSMMGAGGGCQVWGLTEVTEGTQTVNLTTYRYYSGSVTYSGKLVAIRLI